MAEPAHSTGRQKAFAAAILDPARPTPAGLISPDKSPAVKRFAIYRNNVTVSLVNALADIFPTVQNLVGEDFFRAMARIYVENHPPTSRILFEYGQGFADFISVFEPAKDLPYLPDVARLERFWLDSFHAVDAIPLDATVLSRVSPERLGDVSFAAHPATKVFRGAHAAISIVARDRVGEPLDGLDPFRSETGLISRPQCDPELRHLPAGGEAFFETLMAGRTLTEAAGTATAIAPDFDLAGAIGAALQSGAFVAAMLEEEELK